MSNLFNLKNLITPGRQGLTVVEAIKSHIEDGANSGYSWHDILWYLMRSYSALRCPYWFSKATKSEGYYHIASPVTIAYNAVTKNPPRYHQCEKCGWVQYLIKKCNRC